MILPLLVREFKRIVGSAAHTTSLVRKQLRFMANFYHVVAPRYYLPQADRILDAMFQNMHTPFEVVSLLR
jgi:hypothetical protein